MSGNMLSNTFNPVVSHLLRICGFLPVSLKPDSTGLPVFSKGWCCYSFFVGVYLGLNIVLVLFEGKFLGNVHVMILQTLFILISYVSIWFTCKSGVLREIIRNFAEFDGEVNSVWTRRIEVRLLFILNAGVMIASTLRILLQHYFSMETGLICLNLYILNMVHVAAKLFIWVLMCLVKQKMHILNSYLKNLQDDGRSVEVVSGRRYLFSSMEILTELYERIKQDIFLIKLNYGPQLLANYILLIANAATFSVVLQITRPQYWFIHHLPWIVLVFMVLLFFSWITTSIKIETEMFCNTLRRMVNSRLSPTARRQIKTLRLRVCQQSKELSSICFSFYSMENFLSVLQFVVLNYLSVYFN